MLLSLGHSNLAWSKFADIVRWHDLHAVIDVRSCPKSRFPHFGRVALRTRLNELGTSYVFAGDRLGGLSAATAGYDNTARSRLFCEALEETIAISRRCRVALLCSEHDPLCCHRFLLIGRALAARGEAVAHILRDGAIEDQASTEERMRRSNNPQPGLFAEPAELTNEAYRAQIQKLGARP